jgi:hypothetical protein
MHRTDERHGSGGDADDVTSGAESLVSCILCRPDRETTGGTLGAVPNLNGELEQRTVAGSSPLLSE